MATVNAVVKPSTTTPFITYDNITTKIAVTSNLIINFILFYLFQKVTSFLKK